MEYICNNVSCFKHIHNQLFLDLVSKESFKVRLDTQMLASFLKIQ